jgi:hypothetical protein
MTRHRIILTPRFMMILLAGFYLLSVFWLKLDRAGASHDRLRDQLAQLSIRLNDASYLDAGRKTFGNGLREQEHVHAKAPAEEVIRALRTVITQALPGVQSDVVAEPGQPLATSTGLSLLPITLTLRIADETLIETTRIVEALRPGVIITRLYARKVEARRPGPPGAIPQLDVTVSGYALIDTAVPGAKK